MNAPKLAAFALSGVLLCLAGCGKSAPPTLGEAFVAAATLNLRPEFAQKTGPAVVLKHGDHLRIIDVRRKFVKVVTDQGEQGWLDSAQLLSPSEMDQFRRANERAQRMPSQGKATVYTELNIHIDPVRQSPSFTKIPEGGSVEVLGHKLLPKNAGPTPANAVSLITRPAPAKKVRKEKAGGAVSLRPPKPPAPKAPANWLALSAERIDAESAETKASLPLPPPPPPAVAAGAKPRARNAKGGASPGSGTPAAAGEDWSLVRTKDHLCGWVLTRNLILSIPDEVAQYAEGKRIAAYFDLGIVQDEEKGVNHNWLWAIASEQEAFDFDSIRVFIWDRRRHRYETAYRDRGLEGYFPIVVDTSAGKPNFSVIVKAADGGFLLRRYQFDGVRVHLLSKDPYQPSAAEPSAAKAEPLKVGELQSRVAQPGWWRKRWEAVKRVLRF